MDRIEAMTLLSEIKHYLTAANPVWDVDEIAEACDMAIEALQNLSKPNNGLQGSDLISRQEAIMAVANYLWHYPNEQYKNLNVFEIGESLVKDALSIVPSAKTPTVSEKHQLSEETSTNTSTDLISRQDAIKTVCNAVCEYDVSHYPDCNQIKYCDEIQALISLPSADAVEVVRCKDCETIDENGWCEFVNGYVHDGFCAWGKRKGGDSE